MFRRDAAPTLQLPHLRALPGAALICLALVACDDAAEDAGASDAATEPGAGSADSGSAPDTATPEPDAAPPQPDAALPDGPTALFDPGSEDFFALPFPEDARRAPDGQVLLSEWPDATSTISLFALWADAADELLTGWGVTSAFYIYFDGPLDPDSLPAQYQADGPVQLVDVDQGSPDRGTRFPLDCRFEADAGRWHPENMIACRTPFGFVRRPLTRYAIVVTREVLGADGEPVRPSDTMWQLLSGEDAAGRTGADYTGALEAAALTRDDVSMVGLFTTHDPTARLRRVADWYAGLPAPELDGPIEVLTTFSDYAVVQGRVWMPVIQQGERPYRNQEDSGRILFDDDGLPMQVDRQSTRFAISIPKSPMPAAGFPVLLYMHGSGGNRDQFIIRGPPPDGGGPSRVAAQRGAAVYGFDFPLHGDRNDPPDTTGLMLYNLLGNPRATVDNFIISACEVMVHSRLLQQLTIDPALAPEFLDPGDDPDGLIRFDPEHIVMKGQSMGATIGVPAATVNREASSIILSGSGGTLIEVGVSATDPFPLTGTLARAFQLGPDEQIDRFDPILNAVQHLWDLIDPTAHAPYMSRDPHEGIPPKNVLHVHGLNDTYFSDHSRAAI
ncbi:MAG: hypothetical protein ACYTF3_00470 [Planctomycetota bacterium]|jgi:hypothetical protein